MIRLDGLSLLQRDTVKRCDLLHAGISPAKVSILMPVRVKRDRMIVDTEVPENIQQEDRPCPLGCAWNDQFLFAGIDRLHNLPGSFRIMRCKTCGLMRTTPSPTPETMAFYYPDDYGPYVSTKVNPETDIRRSRPLWKRVASLIFEFNTTRLPRLTPGRMLEIGCASGGFLHQMAQKGWKVSGVEFSDKAAGNARAMGYDVYSGPVEHAPEPQFSYDLIVGWMVLEHLHDPVAVLRKLNRWTKPGGWLVVSVPNAGSLEFRLFKDAWYALQVPTHLFHYTQRTLQNVLYQGGWQLTGVYHHRVLSNLLPSMGYMLSDRGVKNGVVEALIRFPERAGKQHYFHYPLAYILSRLGQTGRMTVWARKKE